MRISDWSSDVCSSDLVFEQFAEHAECGAVVERLEFVEVKMHGAIELREPARGPVRQAPTRSEEHTSELQSLMRISYAVFCLKKKKQKIIHKTHPLTKQK